MDNIYIINYSGRFYSNDNLTINVIEIFNKSNQYEIEILNEVGIYYLNDYILFNINFICEDNNFVFLRLKPYVIEHIRNKRLNELLS